MRFHLLGPLKAEQEDGEEVPVPQARLRSLLIVLLLNNQSIMGTSRLCELLWGVDLPQRADHAIHSYVSALRKFLGPAIVIRNLRPGYMVDLTGHYLDVADFRAAYTAGLHEFFSGDYHSACESLGYACSLWRDSQLVDFPQSQPMKGISEKLVAEFDSAAETLIDSRMAIGQHNSVIPELRRRVILHPGNERTWAQLMLALYRSNMRSHALNVYREARHALADASGIDPGPSIRRLHEQILCDDPALSLDPLVAPLIHAP